MSELRASRLSQHNLRRLHLHNTLLVALYHNRDRHKLCVDDSASSRHNHDDGQGFHQSECDTESGVLLDADCAGRWTADYKSGDVWRDLGGGGAGGECGDEIGVGE